MEILKELLGFVVLTGPLFLIIIWLPVSIWAAAKVSKRYTGGSFTRKLAVGVVVFVAIALVPFADHIVGSIYFGHLCGTEAGLKVYQTVELPAEYWGEEERPRFLKPNGDLDKTILGNRFSEPALQIPYSNIFGIAAYHQQMRDNSTQEILGEVITFMHKGGWVSRNMNPSPSAVRCKKLRGNKFWREFHSKLFRPENPSK